MKGIYYLFIVLRCFSLTSFRGVSYRNLVFGKKTHIIGANGSGKTHILDAIHMLSGSDPLYGPGDLSASSYFEGSFLDSNRLERIYRMGRESEKTFFSVQGIKLTRPKYLATLPWRTVHISPFDMNLLYFAPSMRRDYIDLILARTYEQFPRVKRDYEMVMRQRNALLKKIRDGLSKRNELDFWDKKFAEITQTYDLYRRKYQVYIRDAMQVFPDFFTKYPISFYYSEGGEHTERTFDTVLQYLNDYRDRDIITGHTHIGPHRDDWGFHVQDSGGHTFPAQIYMSRGEMKMLLLGLKMIEQKFLSQMLDVPVILLIDDIFAELDEGNSEIFLTSLMQYQVILTSQKPLPNQEKYTDFICINLRND